MTRRASRGFTLFELLIVIAIIGVLAAILLPGLARSRESARRASCAAHLSQIGMALHMYADEHDRQLPWSGGNNNADCLLYFFPRYGLSEYDFICPSDQDNGLRDLEGHEPYNGLGTSLESELSLRASYDYFGAYTSQPISLPPVQQVGFPRVPVMWDKGSLRRADDNHVPGGSNVLWMDGSVSFTPAGRFASTNLPYAPKGIAYLTPPAAPDEMAQAQAAQIATEPEKPRSRWSTSIPVPPPVRDLDPSEIPFLRRR